MSVGVRIAGALAALCFAALPVAAERFTDILGQEVRWEAPPARIVSLSPSLTEILYAIGAGDAVVGATRFCNVPPAARALPKVGGVADVSLEAVLVLRPDLVLATRGNALETMESLRDLGLAVYAIETRGDLAQILATIREVGRVTGRVESAAQLADSLEARSAAIAARMADLPAAARPRVYVGELEGAHWTAGPGSYVHAMVEIAGGDNIGAIAPDAWSPLSLEAIIAQDPQVYVGVYGPLSGGAEPIARAHVLEVLATQAAWRGTSLGHAPRILLFHEDDFQRPGPRIFELLDQLARFLHPERMGD